MSQSDPTRLTFRQPRLPRTSSKPEAPVQTSKRVHTLKDGVAIFFLSIICLLAIIQKMETLAITTIVFIGTIAYKFRVRQAMEIGFEFLRRTRVAKIGKVEFTVEQLLSQQAEWIRAALADLTNEQISLLMSVYKVGKYEATDKNKESFRALRARGLIFHNAPSLTTSTEVWLSEFGKEIAASLLQANEPKSASSTIQNALEEAE